MGFLLQRGLWDWLEAPTRVSPARGRVVFLAFDVFCRSLAGFDGEVNNAGCVERVELYERVSIRRRPIRSLPLVPCTPYLLLGRLASGLLGM